MVSKPGCPSVFGCPSEICIFEISLGDFDGQSKKVRHLGATALEPVLLYLFEVPAPPVVPCVTSPPSYSRDNDLEVFYFLEIINSFSEYFNSITTFVFYVIFKDFGFAKFLIPQISCHFIFMHSNACLDLLKCLLMSLFIFVLGSHSFFVLNFLL